MREIVAVNFYIDVCAEQRADGLDHMMEQLKGSGTMVVADTGDFEAIAAFKPRDATTNPSLILAAAKMPQYSSIVDKCVADAKTGATMEEQVRPSRDETR